MPGDMDCKSCGFSNPSRAKFCHECGSGLAPHCTSCGTELPPTAKFCGECGAPSAPAAAFPERSPHNYTPKHLADKILQSKSALEGERKQVTVLFVDVKGSMRLAEQLDPEAWHHLLDRFFEILNEGVHRFEGTVNQYTGDGIMALFGAPIAHEDHAQRACHAALYLRERLRDFARAIRREHGVDFATRMGVNSGDVIVGKIGDDLRMDYTAQGHTVGLAQRIESLAAADSCFLSDETAILVAGFFVLEDLGPHRIKGTNVPLRVHRLIETGAARTRFDVARSRGLSRFVGRSRDLRTPEDALEQTAAGRGQVVGIVAEAGTGKSRLCFEFLEHCREQGMRVYEARGVAHGKNLAFLPILELFRVYFGITPQDDSPTAREKIETSVALLPDGLADTLPLLFEFLGAAEPQSPAVKLNPEARQRQLLGVMRELIRSASETQPTVTLIEDLHWLDQASAEFLDHLVDTQGVSRSLLLLNFRPEYHAQWMDKSWYRQIPLSPLGKDEVGELLADLLGRDPSIAQLTEPIHARTGGNPFFTGEVMQMLIESGQLEGSEGDYRLTTPVATIDVPASVHALLAARIDRLADHEKLVLQTAAVIGKEFSEPVLRKVLDAGAAPDDGSPDLAAVLHTLSQAEFVYEQALYPVSEYTFKHPLTQQVAYDTLLRERRARVHAAVAQATEEIYSEKLDENAALLAHHCEQAGEAWRAALWHRRAAEWAGITNADEGLRHWERVRRLVGTLPDSREAAEIGATACLGILNNFWRLATPTAEATVIFEEGRQLAKRADDLRALSALHGAYACVLGLVDGAADEYVRYSREATRLAEQTEDQGLQLAMRAFLGYGCVIAGRLIEGVESFVATCERLPSDPSLGEEFTGYSPNLGLMHSQAWMLGRLGRVDEATALCDRAESMSRAHGDIEVLTWLQLVRIEVAVSRADVAAAYDCARFAAETGEKLTTQSHMVAVVVLGSAHRLAGQWDEAVPVLEEALRASLSGANREFEGWIRAELARVLLGRGEVDRAEEHAKTAISVSHAQHSRCDELRGHIALAHTQIVRADASALLRAEQALDCARGLVDETGAKLFEAEIHELRAQLAGLRDDALAVRGELEEARQLYLEMGATSQAERLLKEMES